MEEKKKEVISKKETIVNMFVAALIEAVTNEVSTKAKIFWPGIEKSYFKASGYFVTLKKEYYPFYWETPNNQYRWVKTGEKPFLSIDWVGFSEKLNERLKETEFEKTVIVFNEFEVEVERKDIPTAKTKKEWEKLVRNYFGWKTHLADQYLLQNPWK